MPRIEHNEETLRKTLVETKVERRCNLSNRCKFCLCLTVSLIVATGYTAFTIYLVETDEDGSNISL